MQTNNLLRKVTFPIIGLLLMLLYFTGCTQPIQEVPGTTGKQDGFSINFNYSMTGAFDRAVTRASELNRAKMYITNLVTGKTEIHDWIVLIDKETMEATSFSSVTLNMGKYSFELVVTRGSYNYYAKSGVIELKNGANNIPLKLTPVIGDFISDTATVTDLSCIGNLVYKFSTVQLAMVNDPRLGYSINGSDEIIIKLNKTTGLAPVKVCLPDGTYPIELKFYDGTTLLGTNLKKKEIYISSAFTSSTIDLYPLYGECSFDISSGTGEANFTIKLTKELSELFNTHMYMHFEDLKASITVQYPDRSVTEEFLFERSTDPAYQEIATGVIKGLTYGKANIIIDIKGIGYFNKKGMTVARSINENITVGEVGGKLDIVYRFFPSNKVESSLKSIVNLSLYTAEGNPINKVTLLADGRKLTDSEIKYGKNSTQITLDSDTKVLEVKEIKSGKTVATLELNLKPFEIKNITHTFAASSAWSAIEEDNFYNGAPNPLTQTIKVGNKLLRLRQVGFAASKRLEVDRLNSSGNGWVKAAPDYPLAEDESYTHSRNRWAVDSKGRLYLTIFGTFTYNGQSYNSIKKSIRLNEEQSSWQLLPDGLRSFLSDNKDNIYTYQITENIQITMKRWKTDDSGWEEFRLPPLPPPPNLPYLDSSFHDIFTDKEGNFYIVVNYATPHEQNLFVFKYSLESGKWNFLFNTEKPSGWPFADVNFYIDENSNIYTTEDYYSFSYWGAGDEHHMQYNSHIFVGKYSSLTGLFQKVEVKKISTPYYASFGVNLTTYNGEAYITGTSYDSLTTYLAKVNIEKGTIDETLSLNTPLIGDNLRAKPAVAADGTIFLGYSNEKTGQVFYYKKK